MIGEQRDAILVQEGPQSETTHMSEVEGGHVWCVATMEAPRRFVQKNPGVTNCSFRALPNLHPHPTGTSGATTPSHGCNSLPSTLLLPLSFSKPTLLPPRMSLDHPLEMFVSSILRRSPMPAKVLSKERCAGGTFDAPPQSRRTTAQVVSLRIVSQRYDVRALHTPPFLDHQCETKT